MQDTSLITCPLSSLLFAEPVSASDGYIYEKDWILHTALTQGATSPMTRDPLVLEPNSKNVPQLTTMFPIKSRVEQYALNHPEVYSLDSDEILYLPVSKWDELRQALTSRNIEKIQELVQSDSRLVTTPLESAIDSGITLRTKLIQDHQEYWQNKHQEHVPMLLNAFLKTSAFQKICDTSSGLKNFLDTLSKNDTDELGIQSIVYKILSHSISSNNVELFTKLLPELEDVNYSIDYNVTLLHLCVRRCSGFAQIAMTKLLIDRGADLTLIDESFDGQGCTALHMCKNQEMALLLCQAAQNNKDLFEKNNWAGQTCIQSVPSDIFMTYIYSAHQMISPELAQSCLASFVQQANLDSLMRILTLYPQLKGTHIKHDLNITLLDIALICHKNNKELLTLIIKNGWTTMAQTHGQKTARNLAQALNLPSDIQAPTKSEKQCIYVKGYTNSTETFNVSRSESMGLFKYRIFAKLFPDKLTCPHYSSRDVILIQSGRRLRPHTYVESLYDSTINVSMPVKGD